MKAEKSESGKYWQKKDKKFFSYANFLFSYITFSGDVFIFRAHVCLQKLKYTIVPLRLLSSMTIIIFNNSLSK